MVLVKFEPHKHTRKVKYGMVVHLECFANRVSNVTLIALDCL
jgi:hypothetical protein